MDAQVLDRIQSPATLDGRVAVVTGSTSGIGLGVARALADAGADIVLNGLGDRAAIDAACAELERAHGARILYSDANLLEPTGARALVETARAMVEIVGPDETPAPDAPEEE